MCNLTFTNIEQIKKEIDDTQNILKQICDEENLQTYYTLTIDERLNEAKIRLDMAKTRIREFEDEARCMQLSTSGFY